MSDSELRIMKMAEFFQRIEMRSIPIIHSYEYDCLKNVIKLNLTELTLNWQFG